MKIAYRYWSTKLPILYVAQTPGMGGKDWGYSSQRGDALVLSDYWARRFSADCRRAGADVTFFEVLK